jgi:hypothetical protein
LIIAKIAVVGVGKRIIAAVDAEEREQHHPQEERKQS